MINILDQKTEIWKYKKGDIAKNSQGYFDRYHEEFRGRIVKIDGDILTILLPGDILMLINEYWTIPENYEQIDIAKDK